jgi:hypothetical protein
MDGHKLADGSLSTDYTLGDKFVVVGDACSCSETTVGEIVILDEDDFSPNPYFIAEDGSGSGERVCFWGELKRYENESLPIYTQSELDYIRELESRIDQLEELCSDYARIVVEKDNEISIMKDSISKHDLSGAEWLY